MCQYNEMNVTGFIGTVAINKTLNYMRAKLGDQRMGSSNQPLMSEVMRIGLVDPLTKRYIIFIFRSSICT